MSQRFDARCTVAVHDEAPRVRVTVVGDLDRSSSTEMVTAVRAALSGGSDVILDLTRAEVVASGAIGELIRLHKLAVATESAMDIEIDGFQQRLLDIAGLGEYLCLVPTNDR